MYLDNNLEYKEKLDLRSTNRIITHHQKILSHKKINILLQKSDTNTKATNLLLKESHIKYKPSIDRFTR